MPIMNIEDPGPPPEEPVSPEILQQIQEAVQEVALEWTLWQAAIEAAVIAEYHEGTEGLPPQLATIAKRVPKPPQLPDISQLFGFSAFDLSPNNTLASSILAVARNEPEIFGAMLAGGISPAQAAGFLLAEIAYASPEVVRDCEQIARQNYLLIGAPHSIYMDHFLRCVYPRGEKNPYLAGDPGGLQCSAFSLASAEWLLCSELNRAALLGETSTAKVHQHLGLGEILDWFHENKEHIRIDAESFGIPPALLAGILVSEMVWDYNWKDVLGDEIVNRLHGDPLDSAPGYANVHKDTWEKAYEYWTSDGLVSELPGGTWRLDHIYQPSYLVTDSGAIQAAGIVTRWLVERYSHGTDLSPEQMALIFAAYRQGEERISDRNDGTTFQDWIERKDHLPRNADFALPIMKYMTWAYNSE